MLCTLWNGKSLTELLASRCGPGPGARSTCTGILLYSSEGVPPLQPRRFPPCHPRLRHSTRPAGGCGPLDAPRAYLRTYWKPRACAVRALNCLGCTPGSILCCPYRAYRHHCRLSLPCFHPLWVAVRARWLACFRSPCLSVLSLSVCLCRYSVRAGALPLSRSSPFAFASVPIVTSYSYSDERYKYLLTL